MATRRTFLLGGAGAVLASAVGAVSYATVIEPGFMLDIKRYRLTPAGWPTDFILKISVITDLHACRPWMGFHRVRRIGEAVNALRPDIIFMLGDFNGGVRFGASPVYPSEWAEALSILQAPLGTHAVLGNHDWWHGALPSLPADEGKAVRDALRQMGARLYENEAVRLEKDGRAFWLVGLGDQLAFAKNGSAEKEKNGLRKAQTIGADDLEGALARVADDAPILLMAHEPDIFDRTPTRVAAVFAGHTHGGQVNLPFVSQHLVRRHINFRYIYGHYQNAAGSHMIVSAGLGNSFAPVRMGRPPEIVEIIIAGPDPAMAEESHSRPVD